MNTEVRVIRSGEELKPCPFCGSTTLTGPYLSEYRGDSYSPHAWIECCHCPCGMEMDCAATEELVQVWNTRAKTDNED